MKVVHEVGKFRIVLALAFIAVLSNCGKSTTTNTATVGTFSYVWNIINTANCVQCHAPGASATVNNHTTIDFSSQTTAYSTLMNTKVTGTSTVGYCPNVYLVVANTPNSSYLLGTLVSSYDINNFAGVSGCQPYSSHITSGFITSTEGSAIATWISNGAPNN